MSFRGKIKRGEIYIANLDPALGSEEGKERRVLIVSNDVGNAMAPVVIALPITGEVTEKRKKMPMYVSLSPTKQNGQTKEALIDCGQIRVLDINKRLSAHKGIIDSATLKKVDAALETVLQLNTCPQCTSVLLPNRKHCVSCKHILVEICKGCHTEISTEFNFCPHCATGRGGEV